MLYYNKIKKSHIVNIKNLTTGNIICDILYCKKIKFNMNFFSIQKNKLIYV